MVFIGFYTVLECFIYGVIWFHVVLYEFRMSFLGFIWFCIGFTWVFMGFIQVFLRFV